MKIVKKHKMIALVIVILICLLYLKGNSTYTSYESEVTGNVESDIADWKKQNGSSVLMTMDPYRKLGVNNDFRP